MFLISRFPFFFSCYEFLGQKMLILNSVLNPSNQTAMPIPTATTQAVAFADVSSATNVPFTSGIVATTTAPSASTSTAGANTAAHSGVVGMVGAAALFGMVAAGL
jgi:transforming growth factor-beta-induced protein